MGMDRNGQPMRQKLGNRPIFRRLRTYADADPVGEGSSYLLAETKRRDPDRYLCALFAPADRRDSVLALVLFNGELARIPTAVTQPMTGLIRLQWWRDALDELAAGGRPRRHPVVEALADLLVKGHAVPHALHAMIDAREPALDGATGTETAAVEALPAPPPERCRG